MRRVLLLLALSCANGAAQDGSPDPALLYAEHSRSGRFFNPWESFDWSLWRFLRWQLSPNPFDKSDPPQIPVVSNDGGSLTGRESSASVTWIGHATVAIHDEEDVLLTDPHFGSRALLPRRTTKPGVPLEAIPSHAFAVISHNHYDHLDAYTVEALPAAVEWYVPLGLAEWFRARGRTRVVELDWWESAQRGRWTITCLPAQHWSRRFEHGLNSTLWCSWLLDSGKRRYYFAGDSGYFSGFAEFGRRFGPIDVAILPIGAYEPRWFMRYQHVNPEESYRAFLDLGARFLVPVHWGTFDLTDEPLDLPPKALREAIVAARGDPGRVRLLAIGERWRVPDPAQD